MDSDEELDMTEISDGEHRQSEATEADRASIHEVLRQGLDTKQLDKKWIGTRREMYARKNKDDHEKYCHKRRHLLEIAQSRDRDGKEDPKIQHMLKEIDRKEEERKIESTNIGKQLTKEYDSIARRNNKHTVEKLYAINKSLKDSEKPEAILEQEKIYIGNLKELKDQFLEKKGNDKDLQKLISEVMELEVRTNMFESMPINESPQLQDISQLKSSLKKKQAQLTKLNKKFYNRYHTCWMNINGKHKRMLHKVWLQLHNEDKLVEDVEPNSQRVLHDTNTIKGTQSKCSRKKRVSPEKTASTKRRKDAGIQPTSPLSDLGIESSDNQESDAVDLTSNRTTLTLQESVLPSSIFQQLNNYVTSRSQLKEDDSVDKKQKKKLMQAALTKSQSELGRLTKELPLNENPQEMQQEEIRFQTELAAKRKEYYQRRDYIAPSLLSANANAEESLGKTKEQLMLNLRTGGYSSLNDKLAEEVQHLKSLKSDQNKKALEWWRNEYHKLRNKHFRNVFNFWMKEYGTGEISGRTAERQGNSIREYNRNRKANTNTIEETQSKYSRKRHVSPEKTATSKRRKDAGNQPTSQLSDLGKESRANQEIDAVHLTSNPPSLNLHQSLLPSSIFQEVNNFITLRSKIKKDDSVDKKQTKDIMKASKDKFGTKLRRLTKELPPNEKPDAIQEEETRFETELASRRNEYQQMQENISKKFLGVHAYADENLQKAKEQLKLNLRSGEYSAMNDKLAEEIENFKSLKSHNDIDIDEQRKEAFGWWSKEYRKINNKHIGNVVNFWMKQHGAVIITGSAAETQGKTFSESNRKSKPNNNGMENTLIAKFKRRESDSVCNEKSQGLHPEATTEMENTPEMQQAPTSSISTRSTRTAYKKDPLTGHGSFISIIAKSKIQQVVTNEQLTDFATKLTQTGPKGKRSQQVLKGKFSKQSTSPDEQIDAVYRKCVNHTHEHKDDQMKGQSLHWRKQYMKKHEESTKISQKAKLKQRASENEGQAFEQRRIFEMQKAAEERAAGYERTDVEKHRRESKQAAERTQQKQRAAEQERQQQMQQMHQMQSHAERNPVEKKKEYESNIQKNSFFQRTKSKEKPKPKKSMEQIRNENWGAVTDEYRRNN